MPQYGLDQPLPVQYWRWLRNLFTLEFGNSFKDNQPVWRKIAERLPVTIQLNAMSLVLIYAMAIPLGIYSATHPYSFGDQVTTFGAFCSLPSRRSGLAPWLLSFSVVVISSISFRLVG